MVRAGFFWMMAMVFATAALAQGVGSDDVNLRTVTVDREKAENLDQVLRQVEVAPAEMATLLEKVEALAKGPAEGTTSDELASIHREIGRQTAAFKKAQSQALPARPSKTDDLDALFAEVIDGKAHGDPNTLKTLVACYETLYTQFGQYVNARFLASNQTPIPTFKGADANRTADAAQISAMAAERAVAYQANAGKAASELRALLALQPRR